MIRHTSPATFKSTLMPTTAPSTVKPNRLTVPSAPDDRKTLTETREEDGNGGIDADANT